MDEVTHERAALGSRILLVRCGMGSLSHVPLLTLVCLDNRGLLLERVEDVVKLEALLAWRLRVEGSVPVGVVLELVG